MEEIFHGGEFLLWRIFIEAILWRRFLWRRFFMEEIFYGGEFLWWRFL